MEEGGAAVPGNCGGGRFGRYVGAVKTGTGDEGYVRGLEAGVGEERRHLLLDLGESAVRPANLGIVSAVKLEV